MQQTHPFMHARRSGWSVEAYVSLMLGGAALIVLAALGLALA